MKLSPRPFIFLRHGETLANAADVVAGFTDVELTPKGRAQAEAARKHLPEDLSHVATSTLSRAYITARLAAPGHEAVRHEALKERNWGRMEGEPVAALGGYYETPPGGESFDDFLNRITRGINIVIEAYDNPLIVAHSGMYRVLMHHLSGNAAGPRINNCQPVFFSPPPRGGTEWTVRRIE